MALSTQPITLGDGGVAVRIVAIGAHHTGLVHFALYKRSVNVHFIANLPIRPIQGLFNKRQPVRIEQVSAIMVVAQCAAPCMAAGTVVNLNIVS